MNDKRLNAKTKGAQPKNAPPKKLKQWLEMYWMMPHQQFLRLGTCSIMMDEKTRVSATIDPVCIEIETSRNEFHLIGVGLNVWCKRKR